MLSSIPVLLAATSRCKVGDIVISTNVTHHDVSKTQMKNLFPFQEEFYASKKLMELARTACNSSSLHIGVHEGES